MVILLSLKMFQTSKNLNLNSNFKKISIMLTLSFWVLVRSTFLIQNSLTSHSLNEYNHDSLSTKVPAQLIMEIINKAENVEVSTDIFPGKELTHEYSIENLWNIFFQNFSMREIAILVHVTGLSKSFYCQKYSVKNSKSKIVNNRFQSFSGFNLSRACSSSKAILVDIQDWNPSEFRSLISQRFKNVVYWLFYNTNETRTLTFFLNLQVDNYLILKQPDTFSTGISLMVPIRMLKSTTIQKKSCVIGAPGYFGPNNQLLSHIQGIKLAKFCKCRYQDLEISPHHSDKRHSAIFVKLSNIFQSAGFESKTFSPRCYFGGMATSKGTVNFWKNRTPLADILAYFGPRDLEKEQNLLCFSLKLCGSSLLNIKFRKKLATPRKNSTIYFNDEISHYGDILRRKSFIASRFLCVMWRIRDNFMNTRNPFDGLPLCKPYKNPETCLLEFVQRFRAVKGNYDVLIISARNPNFEQNVFNRKRIWFLGKYRDVANATAVWEDISACSRAVSILYFDNMEKMIGMGGGMSTLYEILNYMGRNGTNDLPLSKIAY